VSAYVASSAAVESREQPVRSVRSVRPADSVRALQHALYRAAKADPGRRFHALRDKIYRRDPGDAVPLRGAGAHASISPAVPCRTPSAQLNEHFNHSAKVDCVKVYLNSPCQVHLGQAHSSSGARDKLSHGVGWARFDSRRQTTCQRNDRSPI
jgi:hypothetical protein